MSKDKENKIIEKQEKWNKADAEWFWYLPLLLVAFGGLGNSENPKFDELEKKVARLEGQMSMIGGKNL